MEDSKIFIDELSDYKESSFDIEIKDLNEKLRMSDDNKELCEDTITEYESVINDSFVSMEENIAKINDYLDNDKKVDEMIIKKMNTVIQKLDKIVNKM